MTVRNMVHNWLQDGLILGSIEPFVEKDLIDWSGEFRHELKAKCADFDQKLDALILILFFCKSNG